MNKRNTANEQVTFYPTYGYLVNGVWHIPMRIWVREAATGLRKILANQASKLIRDKAGLHKLNQEQLQMFMLRAENFVADNESFEKVEFQFDHDPKQHRYHIKDTSGGVRTDFNGLQHGTLTLTAERADELLEAKNAKNGWLTFNAVSDDHVGKGQLRLINPTGTSVISDIDDTIKITDISAGQAVVLMNTFFKDFVAAPGMLDFYHGFGADTAFHYVSGGPWQMFEPLAEFLFSQGVGFPSGSIHMKNVRLNPFESESYHDLWQLISKGSEASIDQKTRQISNILAHFPGREFILVGDSGEHDPEIYQQIKTSQPKQIKAIHIRDVVGDYQQHPERFKGMHVIDIDSKYN
ncbi:DUF2183 domain-containing protein [Marinicella sp. S1101]|uniref:phosphatidate phosphatase App1 family protein n=1 Tax=Marinicella marina TaxID=2996016 RepID=UPI002260B6DA|nr:phosphatase domain-containing protein [Marinicella marina]MCX7553985.1 DUF2183 domain-containing protein [Marinicella marina]MDJ1140477.1 DUF2183 domain-containing protein [Marinicella marina]